MALNTVAAVDLEEASLHDGRITSFQGNPLREPPREVHALVEGHRGPLRPIEPQWGSMIYSCS